MTNGSEQPNQARWRLILQNDSDQDQTIPVTTENFLIGREEDNDLVLDDAQVSGHHVRLLQQDEHLIIEDLGTTNGTSINDKALTSPYVLRAGDAIKLGGFNLVVERFPGKLVQTRPVAPIQTASSQPQRRPSWMPWLLVGGAILLLGVVTFLSIGLGYILSDREARLAAVPTQPGAGNVTAPSIVINQAPVQNSEIRLNQSITIQATASDKLGITRFEFWVNNVKVDEVTSQLAQTAPSMTAAFRWESDAPGVYELELRAYNQVGAVNIAPVAAVTVAGNTPSPVLELSPASSPTSMATDTPLPPSLTPTPTATDTPVPVTPVPTTPSLLLKAPILMVRAGPGSAYDPVGRIESTDQPEIVGQAAVGSEDWWQIRFSSGPNGLGWVLADPDLAVPLNAFNVPNVSPPPLPTPVPTNTSIPTNTPVPTATPAVPTPTPTVTAPPPTVIRPPDGKTLLIVSNRSFINQPARLTLSGGKSVGGGMEIDPPPGGKVEIVLEPDFYRALWSAPWNSFTRGADFTAVPGKVVVMWIVPEEGRTMTEVHDELIINPTPTPTVTPTSTVIPPPGDQYVAPAGKALLVAENRSSANEFGVVTISGGSFGGGEQIVLNANTQTPLELEPGEYRAIFSSPVNGGVSAGRDFRVSAGEVILAWIIPEDRVVFMQFPGQPPIQINN